MVCRPCQDLASDESRNGRLSVTPTADETRLLAKADQRSAYFPTRKLPAVDGRGAVGIEGAAGVKTVRLPAHSPNLNAFAERFVLSIKSECLARLAPMREAHLRRAILEYTNH